jgi:putative regulator of septum formation
MARGWKCPRCSTQNGEGVMNCAKCGLIQGGVFVPSTYVPPETRPLVDSDAAPAPSVQAQVMHSPAPPAAQGVGAPLLLGDETSQPGTGWVPPYPIPAPVRRPIWRRIPIGLLIFGILVVGGAVAGFVTNASRSSTGDITKGGDLTSNDLRVGDCWDMKDPAADSVDNVTARPCGEAHEYEVFYIASMAEGAYPTEDAFTTYVDSTCVPAFQAYVGRAYDASTLEISWLYPGSDGWAAGDRTVECSLFDPNDCHLTGTLQGSRR